MSAGNIEHFRLDIDNLKPCLMHLQERVTEKSTKYLMKFCNTPNQNGTTTILVKYTEN